VNKTVDFFRAQLSVRWLPPPSFSVLPLLFPAATRLRVSLTMLRLLVVLPLMRLRPATRAIPATLALQILATRAIPATLAILAPQTPATRAILATPAILARPAKTVVSIGRRRREPCLSLRTCSRRGDGRFGKSGWQAAFFMGSSLKGRSLSLPE